jgi:signal transduction histidine kinase
VKRPGRRPGTAQVDADREAVRRASRIVGLQITIASGALVVLVFAAAVVFILDQLRPTELRERPLPGEHKIYVDTNEALIALVIVGVFAVIIAGLLSLAIARRAVHPLGEALHMQRRFVQDASHELRTPLAVLDARLQILQRELGRDGPEAPLVAELRNDTRALIDVVGDLLLAAEPVAASSRSEPVELNSAVLAAAASMRVLAERRGIRLNVTAAEPVFTRVPTSSVQRCVVALLDNALAHSPDGTSIDVMLENRARDAVITVADRGDGIRGIDPARIFDRFAHSPSSERADAGRTSFGIGLALVQDVATRHGGRVDVVSTSPDGTTIAIVLPRTAPRP